MTPQELKEAVLLAKQQFNDSVIAARDGGVVVNLWIAGTGPTHTGPSYLDLDFGGEVV